MAHDALFRELVASPARAAALLADYLPPEVAALLDPAVLPEAVEGSFVDEDAARTQCDALFRVRLKSGHEARLYVLFEHKSHIDARTALQILKYLVGIWLREIEAGAVGDRLPAILPLVFYHGRGRWTAARSVPEMIDAPEALRPFLREFAYVVHDLGEIEPRRLSGSPDVRAALLALRGIRAEESLAETLDLITGGPVAGSRLGLHIVTYIVAHMRDLTPSQLEASLRRTKPEQWEVLMGTVAEAWIKQGRAEGIERGRAEGIEQGIARGRSAGQAGIVLRLLQLRFGAVPDAVRTRVRGASTAELEAWAEAVLEAATLDEVLAARPRP